MPKIFFERLTAKEQEELNAGNTIIDNDILPGIFPRSNIIDCSRMYPVITSNAQCIIPIPEP